MWTNRIWTFIFLAPLVMAAGCGPPASNNSAVTTPPSTVGGAPTAPTNLSLSGEATLSTSPTLNWDPPTSPNTIHSYQIGLGTSAGADDILAFSNIGDVSSHQFLGIAPSLALATNYYFSLRAIDTDALEGELTSAGPFTVGLVNDDGAQRPPLSVSTPTTCSEYAASPYYNGEGDGVYWVDVDGNGALAAMKAQCDFTTDGGGWMLILNYLHQGGTNPSTSPLTNSLPVLGTSNLGDDESVAADYWGHASNSLAATMTYSELRFYCASSGHARVVSFKSSHAQSIDYVNTGVGRMLGIQSSFTPFPDHTANLPGAATGFGLNYGNDALIRGPFATSGTYHWLIGALSRWECDDYPASAANHTLHRVWVR